MSFPATYSPSLYRGDTVSLDVLYEEAGVGQDLTGTSVACEIKTQVDGDLVGSFSVAVADQTASPGLMTLSLDASTSGLLVLDKYAYDLELTWTDGRVQTILRGELFVTGDVSQ